MAEGLVFVVVAVVSLFGAAGSAAVTLRHYEPPAPDGDPETPEPWFEAAIFFVLTGVLFAAVGVALTFVGGLAPPYGRIAALLLTPIGYYSAYATYTGRIADDADRAPALMGIVSALVVGTYPVAFDVVALL